MSSDANIAAHLSITLFTRRISLWPNCGFLFAESRKKATLLNVTQKIKATIDQKSQFGHNEMRHVNRLY